MKAGGGKRKGSKFERDIAKRLGLALFNDADSFVRTPGSGALATIRKSTNVPFGGDIMQVKHFNEYTMPYSIECKHYKQFDIYNLLVRNKKSLEYKAWEQCVRDARKNNLNPLLIYRANNRPIYTVSEQGEDSIAPDIEYWLDTELVTIDGVFQDASLIYIPFEVYEQAAKAFYQRRQTEGN